MLGVIHIVAIISIFFFIFSRIKKKENFEGECVNQSPDQDIGITARDACNKISSRAQEIEAELGGAADIITSALAFLSPQNYKSGDNTTDNVMRNIINTNLSSCDITKIENDCRNNTAVAQANILDNSGCKFCETNRCSVTDLTQTNNAEISQTCTIQSAIETLTKKTNSIDSQALAQVLQKADGLLSGSNTFSNENCNIVSTDMSSQDYLSKKSTCANELAVDQSNTIKFCGDIARTVQENSFKAFQTCTGITNVTKETDTTAETTIETAIKAEQESVGFDIGMSAISGAVCCSSIVMVGIILYFSDEFTIEF